MAKAKKRNYRKEYDNYQGRPEQVKRRSSRNKAERKAKCPPGQDAHHTSGNPMSKKTVCKPKSQNRSFARTKTAAKRNKRS